MVREFSEKAKNIEPGQPAFSLFGTSLDVLTATEKPQAVKADGAVLTQLDAHHVQVTSPDRNSWTFELDKPVRLEKGQWTTNFLDCGLKSFTDPKGTNWQKVGSAWVSSTPSDKRLWLGSVSNYKNNAERKSDHTSIYFNSKDGLTVELTDKGTEDFGFDRSSPEFKKDILKLLPKYDLNHNGAWDRAELDAALPSAAGSDAVNLAALDESFSAIASLDSMSSKKLTRISSIAWDRLDKSANTLEHHIFSGKHDTSWKIAAQVADSLRNGYLDLIAGSADKTLKELRQEAANEADKIHQQYKIDIAALGERPHLDKSFRVKGNEEPYLSASRTPRLYELRVFEAALKQSEPSYLTEDSSRGIKLYFLNGVDLSGAAAFWSTPDKNGRQFVAIQPQHPSQNMDELKRIFLHELAHNGQFNMGWDHTPLFKCPQLSERIHIENLDFLVNYDHKQKHLPVLSKDLLYYQKSDDKISSPSGKYGKQIARALGWQLDKDGTVIGLKGIDGQVYKPAKYDANVNWNSVNLKFPRLIRTLDSDAMQRTAVFGTPSDYFPNPKEMHAETMMIYRDGGKPELSPQLLQVIQADDQAEINRVYGMAANGQPKRLRTDNGILIYNPACKQTLTRSSDTTSKSK